MKTGKLIGFILLQLLFVSFNSCNNHDKGNLKEIDCTLLLGKVEVNDVLIYEYETPGTDKTEIKMRKTETITSGSYITNYFDVIGFAPDEKHSLQINASHEKGLVIIEHSTRDTVPPRFVLSSPDTVTMETVIDGPVFEGKIASDNSSSGSKMKVVKIVSKDQNEKWVEFEIDNEKYTSVYVFSTKYGLIRQELFRKRDSGERDFLHRLVFVSFVEGNFSKRARELGIK
jgi:hypothetical protein